MADRPGFFDTFRAGWAPTKARGGRLRAPAQTPTQARRAAPRKPGAAKAPAASADGRAPAGPSKAAPALVKRKEELSRDFAELQWDLGGLAYEMARRDHYRLEVLNAQAAKLQEVDAELGQIERLVKLDEAGAAGFCPACGAMQARGASFCWRCGKEVQTGEPAAKPKAKKPAAKAAPKAKKKASESS
jgi:hypothetical protein